MYWAYEIYDSNTNQLIETDSGFETESEAETHGHIIARAEHLSNYYVRTLQLPQQEKDKI